MNRLEQLEDTVLRLQRQIAKLQQTTVAQSPTSATAAQASVLGAVLNFLRNGDLSWSKDAYVNSPPVGGDTAKEAAHFYTHIATRSHSDYVVTDASPNVSSATAAFTADDVGNEFLLSGGSTVPAGTTVLTFTDATHIVLSNNVTTTGTGRTGTIKRTKLVEDSAHALSSTGHTVNNATGTADPQWDKVNGALQWGSNKSIDCPLPRKMAQPSKQMYVGFIARKKTSSIAIPAGLKLGLGFHDNTSGQRKYLEGGQFTLTASVVGAPAGTTSRKYKIVATTDWGETYESNEVTLATAPNDASYITNSVYVRLDWTKVIGVTVYRIYRLTGATYVLAGEIFNGVPSFNEMNNFLKTEAGYPTTSGTNARAYVQITFDDLTTDWQGYTANVPVPQSYNSSVTTDKQWLRLTLSQALAAGSEQGIEIDKLYVSWNFGNFALAPEDSDAKNEVDTTATSGTQGGAGTGGGGDTPDPGTGGRCVWEEALVLIVNDFGVMEEVPARQVSLHNMIVAIDDDGKPLKVEIDEILEGTSSMLCTLVTENGCLLPCSPDHPVMQDIAEHEPAVLLRKSDPILTFRPGMERAELSPLYAWIHLTGEFRVRIFRLRGGSHLFVAGGIVSHNIKLQE